MNSQEIQKQIDAKNGRINDLDIALQSKDYIGIKIAMGRATKTEYKDEIAQCDAWGKEKNDLLLEVAELKAQQKLALAEEANQNKPEGGE